VKFFPLPIGGPGSDASSGYAYGRRVLVLRFYAAARGTVTAMLYRIPWTAGRLNSLTAGTPLS